MEVVKRNEPHTFAVFLHGASEEMGGGAVLSLAGKAPPILEELRRKAEYQPANGGACLHGVNPEKIVNRLLVLSPSAYNDKVGLAIVCPITRQAKGYPFEVDIPAGLDVEGVILADAVKGLDWRARRARPICQLPEDVVREVLYKLNTLTGPVASP